MTFLDSQTVVNNNNCVTPPEIEINVHHCAVGVILYKVKKKKIVFLNLPHKILWCIEGGYWLLWRGERRNTKVVIITKKMRILV